MAHAGDGSRTLSAGSLVGKYQIVRVIGSGGMGVLYEARHPVLASRLAIKTLSPTLASQGAERFRNEALAASRLRDDRLPLIFDIDQLEDGTPYIVMEYLDGEDLSRRVARGPLDPGYAARLMFEVLELLHKVHTLGIIHRDIKPANIFIARSAVFGEIPKLLDFGVAHIGSATITRDGQVLGTPAYMAPEQALSDGRIGPWTDVFSSAVVLFELIAGSGERPWAADGILASLTALAGTEPPRRLSSLAPWAPPRLSDVIARALDRDPAKRYQSASEFAFAIEPFAADRSVLYRATPAAGTRPGVRVDAPPAQALSESGARRSPVEVALVAKRVAELRNSSARRQPGAPPEPATPHEEHLQPGERRLVVIGYLQAQLQRGGGEMLTANDEEQLMAPFLELFAQELTQQGAVVSIQPDAGLVAVFGDERVREDDAERATAAALAIGRRRVEANVLLTDLGYALTTRIGLHRGFVPRRTGTDARLPLAGETIGLAKRLSESASMNSIVGTSDVIDGLRDWLRLQPFGRLKTPGRDRSVEVMEVLGTTGAAWGSRAEDIASAGHERTAASSGPVAGTGAGPFVGRTGELALLHAAHDRACAQRDASVVVAVTGGPGMGKTRLVGEFLSRLGGASDLPQVMRVQPPPRVSYGLWGALLEVVIDRVRSLGDPGGDVDSAFGRLASALEGESRELLQQQRRVVDLLLGRGVEEFGSGPQQMGDRIQLAVTLCVSAAARLLGRPSRPVIVALENLHRADPASLQLIPKVVPAFRAEVPPFVILTTRDAVPYELPVDTTVIALSPLSPVEAGGLAGAAASEALSPAVHQLVTVRAGGNPLFIEQMIAMLREEGLLGASDVQLRSVAPAMSLYGLFLERVDRLEPPLADALRVASVLGAEFECAVFVAVQARAMAVSGARIVDRSPEAALGELAARGFLVREPSPEGDMYAFDPAQMQVAVYGTILTENRQILHALAAEEIERFHAERPARYFARVLYHYSQSANIERTVHYARLAGERALAMAAYDEAVEHLSTAVGVQDRVPGATDLAAAETLHQLATAYEWRGQLRQAVGRVEEATARLAGADGACPDDTRRLERRARLAMTLGDLDGLLGDWERAVQCYEDAERRFASLEMRVEAAEARCCRGFSYRALGQLERGASLAREGWAVLEAGGDAAPVARAGHELGNLLRDLGRYDEALRIFDRAVASGEELRRQGRMSESTWGALAARSGRAMTHAAMGNMAAAIADQRAVIDLATRDGNRVAGAISEYHLAAHYLDHGDLQSAEAAAVRAEQQCREMDMPGRAFKCRVVQARVRLRMEEWDEAVDHIKTACVAAGRDHPMPDDGLTDAIDVLLSTVDRVPQACLSQAARMVWPLAARGTSEKLRGRTEALKALLGAEDATVLGDRGLSASGAAENEITRLK